MSTTLEIIDGISQVLSNTYDGALDDKGSPIKIGLRREEGNPLIDQRVMDGFGASIMGERLHIRYHCEPLLKEIHSSSFESETESMVEKVKSFIQKEFKKVTGGSLGLSEPSEIDILVEYISRVRTSVKAHKCWKISGSDAEPPVPHEEAGTTTADADPVATATRKWIEQSKKAPKAKNDSRKS